MSSCQEAPYGCPSSCTWSSVGSSSQIASRPKSDWMRKDPMVDPKDDWMHGGLLAPCRPPPWTSKSSVSSHAVAVGDDKMSFRIGLKAARFGTQRHRGCP